MTGPVKVILHGLTDPAQAREAGALGIDAASVVLGDGGLPAVPPERAVAVAAALPPLTARLALVAPGGALPAGFTGAVTGLDDERPEGAAVHIVRVPHTPVDPERIPADIDAVWLAPRPGTGSATGFDFTRIGRLATWFRVVLEVPDGAAGVEAAIRLGRPYAVVLGEAVWYQPGIVDLDRLEKALAVVARLNKLAFG
ncbi:MAG: hypothetical protein KBD01_12820 [Acidobacteria bacterium]|nr:hypothetical protein [Acidobacteriota bacterium]